MDHPRSRGEYVEAAGDGGTVYGSSPLSRGIPQTADEMVMNDRIIPALAGNTDIAKDAS